MSILIVIPPIYICTQTQRHTHVGRRSEKLLNYWANKFKAILISIILFQDEF